MRFYTSVLLCVLVCPITAAFAESASTSSSSYYYDVNNVCTNKLWCNNNPGSGCCSSAGVKPTADKNGYTLRGWATDKQPDVSNDVNGFASQYIDNGGKMHGSILPNASFYPAWARDCVNSNYCSLTIGNDGSVKYESTCPSNAATVGTGANISCQTDNSSNWITLTLAETGIKIYCQRSEIGECKGCYKEQSCTGEKFTHLSNDSCGEDNTFDGYYYNDGQIIGADGKLNENNALNINQNVILNATCAPKQISITFDYSACGSVSSCVHTDTCYAGQSYTLPEPHPDCIDSAQKYTFSSWNINGGTRSTTANVGTSVSCNTNISTVSAVCKQVATGPESINLAPFDMQP